MITLTQKVQKKKDFANWGKLQVGDRDCQEKITEELYEKLLDCVCKALKYT